MRHAHAFALFGTHPAQLQANLRGEWHLSGSDSCQNPRRFLSAGRPVRICAIRGGRGAAPFGRKLAPHRIFLVCACKTRCRNRSMRDRAASRVRPAQANHTALAHRAPPLRRKGFGLLHAMLGKMSIEARAARSEAKARRTPRCRQGGTHSEAQARHAPKRKQGAGKAERAARRRRDA